VTELSVDVFALR